MASDQFYAYGGGRSYALDETNEEDNILLARYAGAAGRSSSRIVVPEHSDLTWMSVPPGSSTRNFTLVSSSSCSSQASAAAQMAQKQKQSQTAGRVVQSCVTPNVKDSSAEDLALKSLVDLFFPRLTLETIAETYVLTGGDVNMAADALSTVGKAGCVDSSHKSNLDGNNGSDSWNGHSLEEAADKARASSASAKVVPLVTRNSGVSSKSMDYPKLENGWGRVTVGDGNFQNGGNYIGPPDFRAGNEPIRGLQDVKDNFMESVWGDQSKRSSSRLSASAPVYEFQGAKNWPQLERVPPPPRPPAQTNLAAIAGSVSRHMRRRNIRSGSGDTDNGEMVNRGGDLQAGNWYHSGKVRKRTDVGGRKADEDLVSNKFQNPKDAEEFFHSMFGGSLGVDIIKDVLEHYPGEPDKALETLLNIGSTSDGAFCSGDPGKIGEPIYAFLEKSESDFVNGDVSFDDPTELPDQKPCLEGPLANINSNEEFRKLCEDFPTVDQGYLAAVFTASEFSYVTVVDTMRDSGLLPASEQQQYVKPKLDAREVLRTLFSSESRPQEWPGSNAREAPGPPVTKSCREPAEFYSSNGFSVSNGYVADPSNPDDASKESWSVVASKPKTRRIPEMAAKLNSDAQGQWNEYSEQRASANAHWQSMKDCMKEATQAYLRGDRLRAGILSDQGAEHKKLAQIASQKASENIFNVRNKDIENDITIDLHAQHVAEAKDLLRLHLRSLSLVPSVRHLRVITGQGSHSADGRPRIKPAVTKYLERKGIPWAEINPGCILVAMADVRAIKSSKKSPDNSADGLQPEHWLRNTQYTNEIA